MIKFCATHTSVLLRQRLQAQVLCAWDRKRLPRTWEASFYTCWYLLFWGLLGCGDLGNLKSYKSQQFRRRFICSIHVVLVTQSSQSCLSHMCNLQLYMLSSCCWLSSVCCSSLSFVDISCLFMSGSPKMMLYFLELSNMRLSWLTIR